MSVMEQQHTPWRAVFGAMMFLVGLGCVFSAGTASRVVGVLLLVAGFWLGMLALAERNRTGK
ncbi:MAG: hypothetical protein WCI74_05720 [Actinomycetes bacterium]